MITTVTTKNMISIPAAISRHFDISPGYQLDWQASDEYPDQIQIRVIPTRAILAKRLKGSGKIFSPQCDAVAALVTERSTEDEV